MRQCDINIMTWLYRIILSYLLRCLISSLQPIVLSCPRFMHCLVFSLYRLFVSVNRFVAFVYRSVASAYRIVSSSYCFFGLMYRLVAIVHVSYAAAHRLVSSHYSFGAYSCRFSSSRRLSVSPRRYVWRPLIILKPEFAKR